MRAVLELNPSALSQAAALDLERKLFGKRSAMHGIPILLKVRTMNMYVASLETTNFLQDNIATVASEGL